MSDDFSQAVAAYQRATWPVLTDPAVWREESASAEQRLLAWPRPADGTTFNWMLSILFNADVDVLLVLLKAHDDPRSPAWPPDVHDPKMQVLLRVVQRALQAGAAALVAEFGGERITGRRAFVNRSNEAMADLALRSGLKRDEAFAALGLGRRQGFRANKRARRK